MTIDHEQLARELEAKFADRFTDKDEGYVKELNSRPVSPPCIYPYFNHQNRGRGQYNNNRQDNNRPYNRSSNNNQYNNSYNNYRRPNQYGQQSGNQSNQGHHHYNSERQQGYKRRRDD